MCDNFSARVEHSMKLSQEIYIKSCILSQYLSLLLSTGRGETRVPTVEYFIKKINQKFYRNIHQHSGAVFYNVGNKSLHIKLNYLTF